MDAEAILRTELRRSPTSAWALCELAALHCSRGDEEEALRLCRDAQVCNPAYVGIYPVLARVYLSLGRTEDAASTCRQWSAFEPANPEAQHMLAALTGESVPPSCSPEYVRVHFDRFAASFDRVLVDGLAYRGPELAAAALRKHGASSPMCVLDAGCGTGLCGTLLRPLSQSLVGVDLAQKMVELARERDLYDELLVSDLCTFMEYRPSAFDVIVAVDVLVYFGDLQRPIQAACIALKPRGLLIFSVEALLHDEVADYRLGSCGRYSHGEAYLKQGLVAAGFSVLDVTEEMLRWENDCPVLTYFATARKLA